ncbi:APC family permease [Corynebacterium sp. 20_84]
MTSGIGYRPSWVFSMAVGAAIGWGAFVLPFDWLQSGGLLGSLLGFALGATMVTLVGLSYGAAINRFPVAGGAVAYALAAFGRKHAVVAGWSLALGYTSIVALNASAVTLMFRNVAPDFSMRGRLYSVAGWDIYLSEVLIASFFLVGFAFLSGSRKQWSGRFQLVTVIVMFFAVAFLTLGAICVVGGGKYSDLQLLPTGTGPLVAMASIVAIVPWAYVGFDTIPQLAGEFSFSPRKATGLLLWGVCGATLIYVLMVLATALLVGSDLQAFSQSSWAIADIVSLRLGSLGTLAMLLAVFAGVVTGLNGFYTAASRVLLTMGKLGALPTRLTELEVKTGVPRKAVFAVMSVCLITPWFGRAALSWVVDMASVGITISYLYTCASVVKIGRGSPVLGQSTSTPRRPRLVLVGVSGVVIGLIFLALIFVPGSPGNLDRPALYALIVWFAVAAVLSWIRRNELERKSDAYLVRQILEP